MTAVHVADGRQRLASLWQQPLQRTGHLLVVNSVLNAGTGMAYWLLAARLNPPGVVGISSAAISAMMLLAGATQLNLMSAILRFVPTAGPAAGRMIRGAYLIGSVLAGLAAIGFLTGLRHWAPSLTGLLAPGVGAVSFVIATMCWSVFVMQDTALVALRRPGAVPVENLAFAVGKIILVVALSLAVPAAGVWFSWAGAMILAVAGTTGYLFLRAVPAFAAASPPGTQRVASARDLIRYIGPDYAGGLAYLAATSLTPLLVLDLTNPRQSAAFALAWQICVALYAVPIAFGQSLVAHGASEHERLDEYHRQARRQTMRLVLPAVAAVIIFAPLGLRLFGGWYAGHSMVTLRLLALSAVPNVVVALAVSRARVARRMTTVVTVLMGLTILVLGLTVVLVPRLGIVGGGIAWLGGQLVIAVAVIASGPARQAVVRLRGTGGVPARTVRAVLAAGDWQRERALPTVSDTALVMVRSPDGERAALKVATTGRGVASLQREQETLRRLWSDGGLGDWRALLPEPLAAGQAGGGAYLLTRRLPGLDGRRLVAEQAAWLTPAAISAIAPLHLLAAEPAVAGAALLRQLVDEPASRLRQVASSATSLERLVSALRARLEGHRVTLGWTHGDFYPGNVLVSARGQVVGIVDWGQARERDLAIMDIAFWLLTLPCLARGHPLGAEVAARLAGGRCWSAAESKLLAAYTAAPFNGRALLLLVWLRHVADNISKSSRYGGNVLWARRNVAPVLRQVADLDAATAGWGQ